MKTQKKLIKLGFLMAVIGTVYSMALALGADSLTVSVDHLHYASKSLEPIRTIYSYSNKIIELEPHEGSFMDEATYLDYLHRLESQLKPFDVYAGISGVYSPPRHINMFYKEGVEITFTAEEPTEEEPFLQEIGGKYLIPSVRPWDHDVQTGTILVPDLSLIDMNIIPGLDKEVFGRSYTCDEVIPVLVGGKKGEKARVGEEYQAIVYHDEDNTSILNTKIAGIIQTPIPVADMLQPNEDVVIIPPILNSDGSYYEQPLPSNIKIILTEEAYINNDKLRVEEMGSLLQEFGRFKKYNPENFFTHLAGTHIQSTGKNAAIFLMSLCFVLLLLVFVARLVNRLVQVYFNKTWHRLSTVIGFSIFCYLLTVSLLRSDFFNATILGSVLKMLNMVNLLEFARYRGPLFIASEFTTLTILFSLAVLTITLIISNLLAAKSNNSCEAGETA